VLCQPPAAPAISEQEWERRFKARFLAVLLKPPTTWTPEEAQAAADSEWEACEPGELMDGYENDPEGAADESMSYWEGDE
jgi:hypothetical protein